MSLYYFVGLARRGKWDHRSGLADRQRCRVCGEFFLIAATIVITGILYYRQLFSPTAIAIGRYVEALKRVRD